MILVCFAVKEEAVPFRERAASLSQVEILLTGIGPHNAEKAIREALAARKPGLVLSSGFAGGLRPGLESGAVVFSAEPGTGLEAALLSAGAHRGTFYGVAKVATTAERKRALWKTTGADAVELESQ